MSKIVVEVNEEFSPWFREVREGVTVGVERILHSHKCHLDRIDAITSLFCDGKIWTILHKHTHCTFALGSDAAFGANNPAVVATDKAGFCIDLALAAFEEGLKVYQNDPPSCSDGGNIAGLAEVSTVERAITEQTIW